MSQNCRWAVNRSTWCQNRSSRSAYVTRDESNRISTASAWPVAPADTWLYVGAGTVPPVYPDTTDNTPGSPSNADSADQKQPAAKVASDAVAGTVGSSTGAAFSETNAPRSQA